MISIWKILSHFELKVPFLDELIRKIVCRSLYAGEFVGQVNSPLMRIVRSHKAVYVCTHMYIYGKLSMFA